MIEEKKKLRLKLAEMNKNIENMLVERREFLNYNMNKFAEFQVGEALYNCSRGWVTKVSSHYLEGGVLPKDVNNFDVSIVLSKDEGICVEYHKFISCYEGLHPWIRLSDYENKTKVYYKKLEKLVNRWEQ